MTTLSSDKIPPTSFEAAQLLIELNEATQLLAVSEDVPDRVASLVDRFEDVLQARNPEAGLAGIDPYLAEGLLGGAVVCLKALRFDDRTVARRSLRIGLEQVRQALRDIVDEYPVSADQPPKSLVRWLVSAVSVSQAEVAEVLGVAPRTLQRWLSESDPAAPGGDDETRVRVVARIVGQLRHCFAGPGTLRWLQRPHPLLRGKSPASLLEDPADFPMLVSLASRARSMVAT